ISRPDHISLRRRQLAPRRLPAPRSIEQLVTERTQSLDTHGLKRQRRQLDAEVPQTRLRLDADRRLILAQAGEPNWGDSGEKQLPEAVELIRVAAREAVAKLRELALFVRGALRQRL